MDKTNRQSILIEVCPPRVRSEKNCLGETTVATNHLYEVWIDSRQDKAEFIDTFFHEITHAFLGMYFKHHIPEKTEHRICNLVGFFAKSVIASYVKIKG